MSCHLDCSVNGFGGLLISLTAFRHAVKIEPHQGSIWQFQRFQFQIKRASLTQCPFALARVTVPTNGVPAGNRVTPSHSSPRSSLNGTVSPACSVSDEIVSSSSISTSIPGRRASRGTGVCPNPEHTSEIVNITETKERIAQTCLRLWRGCVSTGGNCSSGEAKFSSSLSCFSTTAAKKNGLVDRKIAQHRKSMKVWGLTASQQVS